MADLVTGGMVGSVAEETYTLLKSINGIEISLSDTLNSLRYRLKWMNIAFTVFPRDHTDEALRLPYDLLIKCQDLLKKYKAIRKWQLFDKHQCLEELEEVDNQIRAYFGLHLEADMKRFLRPPVETTDLVTAGVVGALLGETVALLELTIEETTQMFRSACLTSILELLKCLKALFDLMRECEGPIDRPDEVLSPLKDLLGQCQYLVMKYNTISTWKLSDKHQCSKELVEVHIQLKYFCSIHLDSLVACYIYNIIKMDDELLDGSEPVTVESTAAASAAGGYGKSTFVSKLCHDEDEQVTASSYQYDVFLSFRGDDTRATFTSFLCYTLCSNKVKPFMDIILRKGNKLEELLKMVEKSRISIVVFSENFAESTWCLKELAKIFQERDRRGHVVVPVFYKVNPTDLRHQSGKIKAHMEKHYNTYGKDSDTVKTWSKAITELANLSGYTYYAGTGKSEVDLALEIAQDIVTRLPGRKAGEQGTSSNLSDIISRILNQLEENQV